MTQRDYAGESKKKGNVNISKILATIAGICIVFGLGLWLLKENTPVQPIPSSAILPPTPPKSSLPSRPDEVYSYIRDLETREVPLDKRVDTQLSAEQEKKLKEEEERRKQEEQLRLAAEQKAHEPQITITEDVQSAVQTPVAEQPKPQTPTVKVEEREATPEEIAAAKKAQEQKALERAKQAEEKRKQELKKQQELAKKAEQEKANVAKLAEQQKAEQVKAEQQKAEKVKVEQAKPQKVIAVAAKPNEQVSNQAGRFGLQCGAFKNKAQAENMQARLAMAGYNARIVSSADWNRVFIGPVGNRASASSAQSNARSVAECVIVSM